MADIPPELEPEPPALASTTKGRRFGGYAAVVALGILLSRLAGLVRNRAIGHYLGTSGPADAFAVAQKVPNILQNMLGEGVLSASFIPVYAKLVAKGDEKLAGRVAGVFVTMLALVVSIFVVLGVVLAPVLLKLTAWGLKPDVYDLTVTLARIIFPGAGIVVIAAWCIGVLNTHRQFFLSYIAPVLWNLAQIITLLVFGARLANRELAIALAIGLVVGCLLQLGIQLPFVFRHARHLSFGLDWTLEPVRAMFRQLGPVVGGKGVVQISAYLDTLIASFLPTGALARILYVQTIYMVPISVFGMSVAAAELPQMASETGNEQAIRTALRKRLDRGLRQISFFVVPTTVAFMVIGHLLVAALYQTGEFGRAEVLLVWYMLIGAAVGLLVSTLGRLYQSTFYALHDTKTPFRFALVRVVVSTVGALVLAFPLRWIFPAALESLRLPIPLFAGGLAAYGAIGITTASALGSWAEYLLLRRSVHHRLGRGERKGRFLASLWLSAIGAGIAADFFHGFIGERIARHLPLAHVSAALMACAVFGTVYFALGLALGIPEVRATLGRVLKRR